MSGTELIIILILALLLLGPDKLPEVAKLVGKGMRDFQKATDDVRSTVESEFYKLEQEANRVAEPPKPAPNAVASAVPSAPAPEAQPSLLPPPAAPSAPASPSGLGSDADLGAKVVSLEGWANKPGGDGKS